jgi:hypothetical protein
MTRRREAKSADSPFSPPKPSDDVLPEHLRNWHNFIGRVELTADDLAGVEQHLRNNPGDTREAATSITAACKAFAAHRRELLEWCRARDLLDENGRVLFERIRPPVDALTRSAVARPSTKRQSRPVPKENPR